MAAFGAESAVEMSEGALRGHWRSPRQMLATQQSGEQRSIHDDAVAQRFGFDAGTIEGPTHFSQFEPLCAQAWGQRWFETGCLSVEYKNPCYAGEEVRASMKWPLESPVSAAIWMEKRNGTEVLHGSASIGPDHPPTALDKRLSRVARVHAQTRVGDVTIGMKSERRSVTLTFARSMGSLYPFSLDEKLEAITEPSPWYTRSGGMHSPWGRPIMPLEMISVLLRHNDDQSPFPPRHPAVELFTAQEIRLIAGPLFTGDSYDIEHEVVALGQTRRTQSLWIRTHVYLPGADTPVAAMLVTIARFKTSVLT